MHEQRPLNRRVVFVIVMLAFGMEDNAARAQAPRTFTPVSDATLQDPPPNDWLMWRRTLDSWGYSPLDEVNQGNVGTIRMVWTRALNEGFQSGTPLVHDGIMYMPNPNDVIQAIDARTGDLIWEHRREIPEDVRQKARIPIERMLAWSD